MADQMSLRTATRRHLHKRDAQSQLPIVNRSCTFNVTLNTPNNFYPDVPKTLWANCCKNDDQGSGGQLQCPQSETFEKGCPENYYSCADIRYHREMCSIRYVDSQDGSGVFGYGSRSRTTQQKCCPRGYSCGGSFDAPCRFINDGIPHDTVILTNPMYVRKIGVYPGCDEGEISPEAVGAIVAVVIIGICGIGSFCLWALRKRLFRSPLRRTRRKSYVGRGVGTTGIVRADSDGTASVVEMKRSKSILRKGRHADLLPGAKSDVYELERNQSKSNLFPSHPRKDSRNDGSFNAVHLDTELPSRVLDITGIQVTKEVQVEVVQETTTDPEGDGAHYSRQQSTSSLSHLDDAHSHRSSHEPQTAYEPISAPGRPHSSFSTHDDSAIKPPQPSLARYTQGRRSFE